MTNEEAKPERPNAKKSDEETLDEPVMDGADEKLDADVDPRKGMEDPALIRDIDSGKKTANPYG